MLFIIRDTLLLPLTLLAFTIVSSIIDEFFILSPHRRRRQGALRGLSPAGLSMYPGGPPKGINNIYQNQENFLRILLS
jgi:hypothetical protein